MEKETKLGYLLPPKITVDSVNRQMIRELQKRETKIYILPDFKRCRVVRNVVNAVSKNLGRKYTVNIQSKTSTVTVTREQ